MKEAPSATELQYRGAFSDSTKKLPREESPAFETRIQSNVGAADAYARQGERLAQYHPSQENENTGSTQAVVAKFITAQDPVIVTANGGRLPAVPLPEALKLNRLRDEFAERAVSTPGVPFGVREAKDGTIHGLLKPSLTYDEDMAKSEEQEKPLGDATPPHRTNPLFPPLPTYGPPTLLRNLQCLIFRASSAVLSLCFLLVIVLGAFFTGIPNVASYIWDRVRLRDPDEKRPFYNEERRRKAERDAADKDWERRKRKRSKSRADAYPYVDEAQYALRDEKAGLLDREEFVPSAGGKDPLICDVSYYASRVGLAAETYAVQTEDGFILELVHLYNPRTTTAKDRKQRAPNSPDIFEKIPPLDSTPPNDSKYPVLLIHGLLQSAGAYCCSDENSLAFYLAKAGLDVWLGNNRCGFTPTHTMLDPTDPRMWAWNLRQMGTMDLPALISRVLIETGFPKLALVAHSQGTTQTLVALAKEQRPEIGRRISVACLLAPAAYAGPLIDKMYLKFMRVISPAMFRAIFGIHSFIPFMMTMHKILPGQFYGFMGYRVFSFLFNWTDERWERDLRNRFFQFSPTYVSSESMRWWLGRECFAKQRCILSTREEGQMEDEEDRQEDDLLAKEDSPATSRHSSIDRGAFAWYDENAPPFALWVAGNDDLVDGRRLLRRFERGREPYVEVVHSKIIEEYEHLDVIWAVDSIDQVGSEVLEVIWKTAPEAIRALCHVPLGCEDVQSWVSMRARA